MLEIIHLRQFEKDVAKAKKRGKDLEKLKKVMRLLAFEQLLSPSHRNHKLKGNFVDYWECHVEPDWLLVYKKTSEQIIFARTGTHADLF